LRREGVLIHLEPIADIPSDRLTAEDIERCCSRIVSHRVNAKVQQPAAAKTIRKRPGHAPTGARTS